MPSSGHLAGNDDLYSLQHQTAFVFTPDDHFNETVPRSAKRRKLTRPPNEDAAKSNLDTHPFSFEPLLNGTESQECIAVRNELYKRSWRDTDTRIQSVVDEANEGTLSEVVSFIKDQCQASESPLIPAGYIVTGPSTSSQGLLFDQLSKRLKNEVRGPAVLLQPGNASNLKNALKQIIRGSTNWKDELVESEGGISGHFGRKLLEYDLEILHRFVKLHDCRSVVVIFQGSEAFESLLLSELIELMRAWMDRIPFVLLFAIATSVTLFHERLPRSASRCLSGTQFDVEQTHNIVESLFLKTVANVKAPINIGTDLITKLMSRQRDHSQSVQSFIAALKYSYMCHFYGNALSIVLDGSHGVSLLSAEHCEAIRMLPSFRTFIDDSLHQNQVSLVREILQDDTKLVATVQKALATGKQDKISLLRTVYLSKVLSPEPVRTAELYSSAYAGTLHQSETVLNILDSLHRMTPDDIIKFCATVRSHIRTGCPEMDVDGWEIDAAEFLNDVDAVSEGVSLLIKESKKSGHPLRSTNEIHSKGLRTTVIAQRVQLSYENITLSEQDKKFKAFVDQLSRSLKAVLACVNPGDILLHEAWLYDSVSPYEQVFAPRPRNATEYALTLPQDYLQCLCCSAGEGLSATQPATASIYQMYLQAGSLINIADLWSTFLDQQNQDDEDFDERKALVSFYQGLVDLKLLGMVKQSKRKVDHLAKVSWNGL